MIQPKLIGPFTQLLSLDHLPLKGPVPDEKLELTTHAGVLIQGDKILQVGTYDKLAAEAKKEKYTIEELQGTFVALPGFIDPHTHICWAGSRARDYTLRLQGKSYVEIAALGGGIWDTVTRTRAATRKELILQLVGRANRHLSEGVTTIEVKSGYGLTTADELKMLQAIQTADQTVDADLIPTCLAAHMCPKDFQGKPADYLNQLVTELLPIVKKENLANRVDIYIDKNAFTPEEAREYLSKVRTMGFDMVIHGDQFTTGGSREAVHAGALSIDHLEVSGEKEIQMLAKSDVIPVALPGSSMGLGVAFAPARKLLDTGASLAIGSDWNPGSAPMGDLLLQASVMGIYEKLSTAETLAGICFRAAAALGIPDRGVIRTGNKADIIAFELDDYREILYNQGKIKPAKVWKNGKITNIAYGHLSEKV